MTQQTSHKNFIKKLLGSKVFLFFITLALIGLAINLGRESYRKYQLTKEINNLKSEIGRLEGKNQQLADLMEYFQEGSYLEKEARLKLNLKKPGEKVVVISKNTDGSPELIQGEDPSKLRSPEIGDSLSKKEEANFWKWWEHFFQ